jgi:membrane dipeptidase
MCDCGFEFTRRQWLMATAMAAAGAVVSGRAFAADPDPAVVREILKSTPTVDTHAHAGGAIFSGSRDDDLADSMKTGGLAAVCLASVPDGPVLGRTRSGGLGAVRAPRPGELYAFHVRQMDWMDSLVAKRGVRRVLTPADLRDAHAKGEPAAIQDIEGCDFLEGNLGRLEEAVKRGARAIQLVHYTPNEVGDFQTGETRHKGLTDQGRAVVKELNRLGVLIDVAHGTAEMVEQAAAASSKPLLLSHTAIEGSRAMGNTPLRGRQISKEHAKMMQQNGGVIGLWHFFPTLDRYVDAIREMVDVVGVDTVCIGTDQQRAKGVVQDYAGFPKLVEKLLASGFTPDETKKLVGGNFMRVFEKATAA